MQDSKQYPNLNGNQPNGLPQFDLNQTNSQQPYSPPSNTQLQATFPVSNPTVNNQQTAVNSGIHMQAAQASTPNQATTAISSNNQPTSNDAGHTDNHQSVEEQLPQIEPISWTASESISQQRSSKWYRHSNRHISSIIGRRCVAIYLSRHGSYNGYMFWRFK